MTDLHREAPLYDQRFPVTFPSEDQPKDSLVLRILEGSQPSQVVGQNEKVFHFEVSNGPRREHFLLVRRLGADYGDAIVSVSLDGEGDSKDLPFARSRA